MTIQQSGGGKAPPLRLYLAGGTLGARRALESRDRLIDATGGMLQIEVVDILRHPEEAERAGILATPTLSDDSVSPPRRLIGDRAYDSAILQAQLEKHKVELVCPLRKKNGKLYTTRRQDGRKLHRYKKRWKVERLFAWLLRFRRLVNRWEPKAENFLGFLQLGCIKILLRRF